MVWGQARWALQVRLDSTSGTLQASGSGIRREIVSDGFDLGYRVGRAARRGSLVTNSLPPVDPAGDHRQLPDHPGD